MKFPNAAKGVKKLWIAEVISLLSIFSMIAFFVFIMVKGSASSGTQGALNASGFSALWSSLGIAVALAAAFYILSVIAEILRLIGIINASRDEQSFKTALFLLIISVVLLGSSGALSSYRIVMSILTTLSELFSFFSLLFVLAGVVKLADRLNCGEISKKGSSLVKLLLLLELIVLAGEIVSIFTGDMVADILTIAVLALETVQTVMLISFLSKAKKMLVKTK